MKRLNRSPGGSLYIRSSGLLTYPRDILTARTSYTGMRYFLDTPYGTLVPLQMALDMRGVTNMLNLSAHKITRQWKGG